MRQSLAVLAAVWLPAVVYWFELLAMMYVIRMPFFRVTGFLNRFTWPSFTVLKEIMVIGLPIGASSFVGMMVFSIVGFLIAGIGVNEIAAHSIAGNLNWLTYVIPMALGSAVSIRVGFSVGAMDPEAVLRVIKTTLIVTLGYAFCVTLLLIVFRHQLVSLYTRDTDVLAIAATLMLFVAFYQIFDDMQATMGGCLRGFKDTLVPMIISLVNYWFICLPLGYLLANGLYLTEVMGVYGYWSAMTFGLFLTAGCVAIRLWLTTRKKLGEMALTIR